MHIQKNCASTQTMQNLAQVISKDWTHLPWHDARKQERVEPRHKETSELCTSSPLIYENEWTQKRSNQ